jgi:hypothetical protein
MAEDPNEVANRLFKDFMKQPSRHFIIPQVLCDIVCAVFLYRKFADEVDMSFGLILSPLMVKACLAFVAALGE